MTEETERGLFQYNMIMGNFLLLLMAGGGSVMPVFQNMIQDSSYLDHAILLCFVNMLLLCVNKIAEVTRSLFLLALTTSLLIIAVIA